MFLEARLNEILYLFLNKHYFIFQFFIGLFVKSAGEVYQKKKSYRAAFFMYCIIVVKLEKNYSKASFLTSCYIKNTGLI